MLARCRDCGSGNRQANVVSVALHCKRASQASSERRKQRSVMNKTAIIEGRVDIRHLATCAAYMAAKGSAPRSKSDLLFGICEMLHNAISNTGERAFKGHEEAYAYLSGIGLGPMTKKRGERRVGQEALSKAISEERGGGTEYDDESKMMEDMGKILDSLKNKT